MERSNTEPRLEWFCVGDVADLKKKKCRKFYMIGGAPLALFYIDPDRFFVSSAICPHARGPLDQGDIEDLGSSVTITCPLHFYSFDLGSGSSASGLKLKTYFTEIRGDKLYILCPMPVSLQKE